jgi:hypothetical protein
VPAASSQTVNGATISTEAVNFLKNNSLTIEPDPVIEAYKKGIDRSLIRENLNLSVEERLHKLMELQRFAEELRRAGRELQKKS